MARLKGSRMVFCSELAEGRRFNESRLKDLTGGDTIVARRLYQNPEEFLPQFKLWVVGNHRPTIAGTDLGVWRRMLLVPFSVTISEERRKPMNELLDGFRLEMSGILNWALQGYRDWKEYGLQPPDEVLLATQGYGAEQDFLADFVEERCVLSPTASVSNKALYSDYFKRLVTGLSLCKRSFYCL